MKITKMSELHNFSLEMLDSFDRLCKKHGLRYCLAYGALLGYARHGSLIPWDDDIDVVMLREDYEKLLLIPQDDFEPDYELLKVNDSKEFFDFVTRYVSKVNCAERKDVCGTEGEVLTENIGMDVFVLDNAFVDGRHAKQVRRLKYTYLQATKFRKVKNKSSFLVRSLKKTAAFIARNKSLLQIIDEYDAISVECSEDTGKVYATNAAPADIIQVFSKNWFTNPTTIELKGHVYPAPNDISSFLTVCYGDYMELPPEECRNSAHYKLEMDDN